MLNQQSKVMGVVLAGGKSSRMGSDKAALYWQDKTFLQHAIRTLQETSVVDVIVSGRDQENGVIDDIQNMGPFGGIRTVMNRQAYGRYSGFLFIPVDMPLLTASSLNRLIETGVNQHQPSYYQNSYLPLFLPNAKPVLDYLNSVNAKNNLSIKGLLAEFDTAVVSTEETVFLTNINNRSDWTRFKAAIT